VASREKKTNQKLTRLDALQASDKPCDFVSRNIRLNGRRTSIRLERGLWRTFDDIAMREGMTTRALCCAVDQQRDRRMSLTAAVRLFTVSYYRVIVQRLEEQRQPRAHRQGGDGFAEDRQSAFESSESNQPRSFSAVMQTALAELG
jgi:predicted DNA-binding ribbon-helix-helix protein